MNSNIERYSSIEEPYAHRLYEHPEKKPSNEVQQYTQKERDGFSSSIFNTPLFHTSRKAVTFFVERLMGEVSKRCKHKWMHWSTEGLRNILTIVLARYTNEQLYNQFKKAYIHNRTFNKTGTAQKANT